MTSIAEHAPMTGRAGLIVFGDIARDIARGGLSGLVAGFVVGGIGGGS